MMDEQCPEIGDSGSDKPALTEVQTVAGVSMMEDVKRTVKLTHKAFMEKNESL